MSEPRTPKPSPLAGEGAEPAAKLASSQASLRREAGEGAFAKIPSAGRSREVATSRARSLRANMTDAERKLWYAFRDRRFADFKFRRQVPIGPFIADFICYDARVVIEVDGSQHADSSSDARRDRWFAANGFLVLRFWNNDVLKNREGVLISVLETLHQRTPHPARARRGRPSPARGEGDGARGADVDRDVVR
jgi:very-short-patch-repair endonuclease